MKIFKNKKIMAAAIAVIVISSIGITTTAFSSEQMKKASKVNTPALSGLTSAELQNESASTSETQPLIIVDPTTAATAAPTATPTATPATPADIGIDDDNAADADAASSATPVLAQISADSVKQIVLAKTPGAVITELELDRDDGRLIYEVKATVGQTEYEYKIDANTGAILEYKADSDDINDADDNDTDDMDDVDEIEVDDEDDNDGIDDKDSTNDMNKVDKVDSVGEND